MPDPINHPPHYQGTNGIEAIDVIEAFSLGFNLGNAVKYLLRAGRKNAGIEGAALEDLRKARWYLDREISSRENRTDPAHPTTDPSLTRTQTISVPQPSMPGHQLDGTND